MSYKFTVGRSKMEVSATGAYIDSLILDGQEVFSKKRIMDYDGEKKKRGGCHVCLPQFGPAGKRNLDQHGFARDMEWEVLEEEEGYISLLLEIDQGEYAGMVSHLIYEISDYYLHMELIVENMGEKPWFISPAFHPYFKSYRSDHVIIDNKKYIVDDLEETQYISGVKDVKIKKNRYKLKNKNLGEFALWTDRGQDYICIEPSHNGPAFSQEGETIQLSPGDMERFTFTIEVK